MLQSHSLLRKVGLVAGGSKWFPDDWGNVVGLAARGEIGRNILRQTDCIPVKDSRTDTHANRLSEHESDVSKLDAPYVPDKVR